MDIKTIQSLEDYEFLDLVKDEANRRMSEYYLDFRDEHNQLRREVFLIALVALLEKHKGY